jgi:hypothetical protein
MGHDLWDEGYLARDEEVAELKKEIEFLRQQNEAYYELLSARKRVEGPALEREIEDFYLEESKKSGREETIQPTEEK